MKKIVKFFIVFFMLMIQKGFAMPHLFLLDDISTELELVTDDSICDERISISLTIRNVSNEEILIPKGYLTITLKNGEILSNWFEIFDENNSKAKYIGHYRDLDIDESENSCLVLAPNDYVEIFLSDLRKSYAIKKSSLLKIKYNGPLGKSDYIIKKNTFSK